MFDRVISCLVAIVLAFLVWLYVRSRDAQMLVQQLDGRRIRATPSWVAMRTVPRPQQELYELKDVPVQFLCPANFSLRALFSDERAGKITVRLSGPAGEEMPDIVAFIDLGRRTWEPGFYEQAVKLQLPANFRLAQDPPGRLAFQLGPLEAGVR